MAIAFVAANHGAGSSVSSINFSLNVGSDPNRFVAVLAGDYSSANDSPPNGVEYNSVALTAGTEFLSAGRKFRLYWGVTTATGANNVVVSYANASSVVYAIAIAYSGVDQTTPVRGGAEVTATGASTTPSVTISSDAADTVTMLILGSANRTFAATSPAVERYDTGTLYFALDEAGAASVTIDGALTGGSDDWAAAALSLVAASGGGGSTNGSTFNSGRALNGGKSFFGGIRRTAMRQAYAAGDRIAAAVQRQREQFGKQLLASTNT